MLFELTEDQKMLRDMVQRFAESELSTSSAEADARGGLSSGTVAQLRDLGLLGLAEDGGDLGFAAVALYELARRDAAAAVFVGEHCAAYAALDTCGEAQGATFALPVVHEIQLDEMSGDIKATAKLSVPFLEHANTVVMRVGLPGRGGLVRASAHILGETQPFRAVGLSAAAYERATFVGQPVEVFGDEHAARVLTCWHTVALAATAAGVARAAAQVGASYASDRKQFGKALVEFQATQFKIADMFTRADAAWLMVMRAAGMADGRDRLPMARQALQYSVSAAKFCSDEALQLHGGYGYTREYPIERYYRDARALSALV